MAPILRRDIHLHFPLICGWFHTTKSVCTNEGWLSPKELNPLVVELVHEFKDSFRWNGERFEAVN